MNVKPYFMFDSTPASGVDEDDINDVQLGWKNPSGAQNADWYMNRQDYWLHAFEKPSFLDLGFVVDTDHFGIVFALDLRQDTLQNFNNDGSNKTNIPFVGALIELNFPQVGYIDYTSDNGELYASIGRRQMKWGPATYGMAISDSQPFLDNVYAEINAPMKNGWNFWYSFTGIAYKFFLDYDYNMKTGTTSTEGSVDPHSHTFSYFSLDAMKSTFAHKFGFENSNFRIYLAELNNIYGKNASLLDFTPCGVWHNNYQDDFSNVMLDLAIEGKVGPVRAFGTFTMDDFDLPHEASGDQKFNSSKPAAMGFSAGIELNLLDGEEVVSDKFNPSDYAFREDTFKKTTGLNIGYEVYYCSKFMYNRKCDSGKFMVPYQFISFAGSGYAFDATAYYLGYKYGPDTLLHRVYVEYTDNPIEAYASVELLKRGNYGINSTYEKGYFNANLETPYDITGPATTVLMIEAGAAYHLQAGFKANAEIGFTKDLTHGTQAFQATVGASINVCDVDWKNLF